LLQEFETAMELETAQIAGDRAKLAALVEDSREGLLTCIHCGLCLPACPTYRVLGDENDSPRGRIYLMRAVAEGRLDVGESFTTHIGLCLGCRACETVCPAGVPYGRLLEASRTVLSSEGRSSGSSVLTRLALKIFMRPRLLGAAMAAARLLRDSGLAELALDAGLVNGRLRFALAMLLASRSRFPKQAEQEPGVPQPAKASAVSGSQPPGQEPLRAALLLGCVTEGLFGPTNRAAERVLVRNGSDVVEAPGQVCCGALHSHAGQIEAARQLARTNIDSFLASGCNRIIAVAAGCGAAMKEYSHQLADDPDYAERAREFASKVRDISEFLLETGIFARPGHIMRRVAYDAPCHLIHAQRIQDAPVEVLNTIPGIEMVPLKGFEECCGGAGIYGLLHPELSSDVLKGKIENVLASGADTLVTANPGCVMQIGAGLLLRRIRIDVIQPVDLLDAAYGKD
jgi:glycolate oxidase iron-sulfur subunit